MTLFRRSYVYAALAVLAVATLFAAALASVATADRKAHAAAAPKASVSVAKCHGAATYAERRLEFRASMNAISDGGEMELRYTLYRRYNNQARFRAVTPTDGSSLGEWLVSSDPSATKYIHRLTVSPVETAASYRVKVAYRWLDPNGKIVKRAKRTSKLCKQTRGLPNLQIESVKQFPNSGTIFPDMPVVWNVTIRNNGASSASLVSGPVVSGTANGGLVDGTLSTLPVDYDSIPAGSTAERQLYGQECRGGAIELTVDPLNLVRERNENDNTYKGSC